VGDISSGNTPDDRYVTLNCCEGCVDEEAVALVDYRESAGDGDSVPEEQQGLVSGEVLPSLPSVRRSSAIRTPWTDGEDSQTPPRDGQTVLGELEYKSSEI
jgi:hypothetical protein